MPDRDHEVRTGEDVQLAELDLFHVIQIPCRAQHGEQRVPEGFEFGPLVTVEGVLNCELVQAELIRRRFDLARTRYRPIHAFPPLPHHLTFCPDFSDYPSDAHRHKRHCPPWSSESVPFVPAAAGAAPGAQAPVRCIRGCWTPGLCRFREPRRPVSRSSRRTISDLFGRRKAGRRTLRRAKSTKARSPRRATRRPTSRRFPRGLQRDLKPYPRIGRAAGADSTLTRVSASTDFTSPSIW